MFIEPKLQKIFFAPEERDFGLERISLRWSEAILFRENVYKHFAALRRGQVFVQNFRDTILGTQLFASATDLSESNLPPPRK
jgi:hypothetical protein